MDAQDLARIIRQLREAFPIAQDAEVTVEGRIRGFTADKAQSWVDAGANRFSIGVQTTDSTLRKRLSRQSERAEIADVLNGLCKSGATVAVDIMYALPGQTTEMLVEDIRFLSEETKIHGLDLYELRVFPDSPLDRAITRGKMPQTPDFLTQAKMFGAAYQKLVGYGFEHFSAKHWRRDPSERSIYNSLAKNQTDMIPFGSGAGGRLGAISFSNSSTLAEYEEMINAGIKPLKRIMSSPLKGEQKGFAQELEISLEKLKLPSLEKWPSEHLQESGLLIAQWQEAGLLNKTSDESGIPLTYSGIFWSQRMKKMLLDFTNSSAHER